jgi:hypothetical protein
MPFGVLGIIFTPLFFKEFQLEGKSVEQIIKYFVFVTSLIEEFPNLFEVSTLS